MIRLLTILLLLAKLPVNAQTMNKDLIDIDAKLKALYPDNEPGLALAILRNDKPVFKKGYGLASVSAKEKIDATTMFNVASVTKQFTAMAIRQLADSGKLSLTDMLGHYIQGLSPAIASSVTIGQLLSHCSGIPDHYGKIKAAELKHAHDEQVLQAVKTMNGLSFSPGTKYHYSNTAYCLLALIVERISGMPFRDYLRKTVLQPAGMKQSFIWQEGSGKTHQAEGYDRDHKGFKRSGPDENVFFSTEGDGGLYSSIDDYLHWIRYWKKTLPEQQFIVDADKKIGYGWGWFIHQANTPAIYYHSGSNGGFRTYSLQIPEEGFGIIILSNRSDHDVEQLTFKLLAILKPTLQGIVPIQELTD